METFHCAPDDSSYIGQRIDKYFGEVIDILNFNQRAREVFIEIEYKTPHREDEGNAKLYPTDDRVGYLRARDHLIACTLEIRDVTNFLDVAMVCTLTPELLARIQDFSELLQDKSNR